MSTKIAKKLFDDFKPQSKQAWLDKIEADLKIESHTDLNWKLGSKMMVSPFAHLEDQKIRHTPINRKAGWRLACPIYATDPNLANQECLDLLSRGCDALHIITIGEVSAEYFKVLFNKINLSWITLQFMAIPSKILTLQKSFNQFLRAEDIDPTTVRIAWGHMDSDHLHLSLDAFALTEGPILLVEQETSTFDRHIEGDVILTPPCQSKN